MSILFDYFHKFNPYGMDLIPKHIKNAIKYVWIVSFIDLLLIDNKDLWSALWYKHNLFNAQHKTFIILVSFITS